MGGGGGGVQHIVDGGLVVDRELESVPILVAA